MLRRSMHCLAFPADSVILLLLRHPQDPFRAAGKDLVVAPIRRQWKLWTRKRSGFNDCCTNAIWRAFANLSRRQLFTFRGNLGLSLELACWWSDLTLIQRFECGIHVTADPF